MNQHWIQFIWPILDLFPIPYTKFFCYQFQSVYRNGYFWQYNNTGGGGILIHLYHSTMLGYWTIGRLLQHELKLNGIMGLWWKRTLKIPNKSIQSEQLDPLSRKTLALITRASGKTNSENKQDAYKLISRLVPQI